MEALDVIATMFGAAIGTGRNGGYVLMLFGSVAVLVLLLALSRNSRPPPIFFRPPTPDEMDESELALHMLKGKVLTKEAELSYLKRELAHHKQVIELARQAPETDEQDDA